MARRKTKTVEVAKFNQFVMYCRPEDKANWKKIAEKTGVSVAALVKTAIDEYATRNKIAV